MDELTPRQRMVLGLVVQDFVRTAAPVGSRALVERYGLNVSAATVRNGSIVAPAAAMFSS